MVYHHSYQSQCNSGASAGNSDSECQFSIWPIVGGVVGGCIFLIITVCVCIYRRKRFQTEMKKSENGNNSSRNKNDLDRLETASQSQPLVSSANEMGHTRGNESITNLNASENVSFQQVAPMEPKYLPSQYEIHTETRLPEIKVIPSHPTSTAELSQLQLNDEEDYEWDSTPKVSALSYSGNRERYSSETDLRNGEASG